MVSKCERSRESKVHADHPFIHSQLGGLRHGEGKKRKKKKKGLVFEGKDNGLEKAPRNKGAGSDPCVFCCQCSTCIQPFGWPTSLTFFTDPFLSNNIFPCPSVHGLVLFLFLVILITYLPTCLHHESAYEKSLGVVASRLAEDKFSSLAISSWLLGFTTIYLIITMNEVVM